MEGWANPSKILFLRRREKYDIEKYVGWREGSEHFGNPPDKCGVVADV